MAVTVAGLVWLPNEDSKTQAGNFPFFFLVYQLYFSLSYFSCFFFFSTAIRDIMFKLEWSLLTYRNRKAWSHLRLKTLLRKTFLFPKFLYFYWVRWFTEILIEFTKILFNCLYYTTIYDIISYFRIKLVHSRSQLCNLEANSVLQDKKMPVTSKTYPPTTQNPEPKCTVVSVIYRLS